MGRARDSSRISQRPARHTHPSEPCKRSSCDLDLDRILMRFIMTGASGRRPVATASRRSLREHASRGQVKVIATDNHVFDPHLWTSRMRAILRPRPPRRVDPNEQDEAGRWWTRAGPWWLGHGASEYRPTPPPHVGEADPATWTGPTLNKMYDTASTPGAVSARRVVQQLVLQESDDRSPLRPAATTTSNRLYQGGALTACCL